jgi:hypothetical protein
MQKLALKDFEFQISSHTWNVAQDLAHAGKVRNLLEVERNFWVAKVQDEDETYEAEVMITPTRIKAYACGCWSEPRKFMCPHIAATLLKVRQYLQHKAEERARQAEANAPRNELTRLTMRDVLADVPAEALRDFVRAYARRDRDFALAIKTWFAGALVVGGENPFLLVFDAVLPKNAHSTALREPDYRRLRRTINDLDDQLESARTEGNLRTVFQIASATLRKVSPLVEPSEEPRRGTLLRDVQAAVGHLRYIFEAREAATELRDAAWQSIFEGVTQRIYSLELHRDVLRTLGDTTHDALRMKAVTDLFFAQATDAMPPVVLHLYLAALAHRQMPEGVVRVLRDRFGAGLAANQIGAMQDVRHAVIELYYLQHDAAATQAAIFLLENTQPTAALRREMEELLLQMAERNRDHATLRRVLRQRYLSTGQTDALRQLKKIDEAAWPAELEILLDSLRKSEKTEQVAALLASEGQTEVLAAYLEQQSDLSLLQRYDYQLEPDFLRREYVRLLSAYLAEHMGKPAAEYVRHALIGLVKLGHKPLVTNIIRDLTQAYPERESLPDELNELLRPTLPKVGFGVK